MKKVLYSVLAAAAILTSTNANALDCRSGVDHKHPACYGMVKVGGYHGHHGHHGGGYGRWVVPAIIGSAIIAGVASAATPPQVYQQPAYPPVYQQQLPAAPYGYHYQLAFDPSCNCNKYVLIPN